MSQELKEAEGIILRVVPFREYDQILTLFTYEQGLIKLIYKAYRNTCLKTQGICMPLTVVRVNYQESRGELFKCKELTWVESYQLLRHSLICLEAACDCLQALYQSQLVGKAAPALYDLLRFYLNKMNTLDNPWLLALSFRLKLLAYEGLACFPFFCFSCSQPLYEEGSVYLTEWGCAKHPLHLGTYWSREEILQVYHLTLCHSYQELTKQVLIEELKEKVISFFNVTLQK